MRGNLAVFAPYLGLPSETFVRRHVEDLLPGRTSVVTWQTSPGEGPRWETSAPVLRIPQPTRPSTLWFRRTGVTARLRRRQVPPLPMPSRRMQDQVVEFLSEQSTTSVLTEYLDAWLPWYDVLRDHGLRVVPHGHGYDVSSRLLDPWYRRQYLRLNTTDAVVVVSHHSARRLVELGVDEDRIHVVPCGVDVPQALPTKGDRAEVRALAVGRMVAKKAPLTTLEAVRVAMERCEGLTLRYLGEGPLQAQAEDFVRRHGLGGRITLLGARNHQEVLDEMRRADLFVQHSVVDPETGDEEGLPVAVLEAMAQGLPVVTTRHGGLPEAVEDGVTGILVDEGDGASMADAVSDLARDPALRRQMGRAGWERARRSFMWTKERIRLLELLNLVEDTGEVV